MTAEQHPASPDRAAHDSPRSLLTWRAIRWRLSSSVAFFIVATVAMAAAALGPLYLTGADQSIVFTSLSDVAPRLSGVTLTPTAGSVMSADQLAAVADRAPGGVGSRPADHFEDPISTTDVLALVESPVAGRPDSMDVIARTGSCADLEFVKGTCPLGSGEIAVSDRSALQLGVKVGSKVIPIRPGGTRFSGSPPPVPHLRVSGIYRPGSAAAPAWWGANFFTYGGRGQEGGGEQLDAGFVTQTTEDLLGQSFASSSWVELPLRSSAVSAATSSAFLGALAAWTARIQPAYRLSVGTNLPALLASDAGQEHLARTVIVLVSLQLLLLALLVLYGVARAASALRAGDVRVAELRGARLSRLVRLVMREPFLLLVAAVPAGVALGWLGVSPLCAAFLKVGAPSPGTSVIAVVFVAFAAGLLAAALGSLGLLREGTLQQSADVAQHTRARNAAIFDALGIALAVSGCADLIAGRGGGSSSNAPLALAGPGLLALGLGIIGARLLPLLARSLVATTRWSKRVGLALAARSISRRDELARLATIPAIAAALLVFAVSGLVVAGRNDSMQAGFELGAPVVTTVRAPAGIDFEQAVRSAGVGLPPTMAAVKLSATYGSSLAVDAGRLAAVASWPPDLSPLGLRRIAHDLAPRVAPERLIGPGVRLTLTADLESAPAHAPDLQLIFFDPADATDSYLDLGRLKHGTHRYSGAIAGLCQPDCRIETFTLYQLTGPVRLRLEALSETSGSSTKPIDAGFSQAGAWRARGSILVEAQPAGLLAVVGHAVIGSPPAITPNDTPPALPAVVTDALVSTEHNAQSPDSYQVVGLDGAELASHAVTTAEALPQIGAAGAMVDLGLAERLQTSQPAGAQFEIWSRAGLSALFRARLSREGIEVIGVEDSAAILRTLRRSGPSLGFDLFLVAGACGLLLAAGALLFAVGSRARQRGIELAGLLATGVERKSLRRSLVLESLMISLTGGVIGFVAGVLGADLAMPAVPMFAAGRVGPPLEVGLPWTAVILSGAAIVVLLSATAVVSALVVVRRVHPDQLRMAA
jgi:putative ABC transport system permease protein